MPINLTSAWKTQDREPTMMILIGAGSKERLVNLSDDQGSERLDANSTAERTRGGRTSAAIRGRRG